MLTNHPIDVRVGFKRLTDLKFIRPRTFGDLIKACRAGDRPSQEMLYREFYGYAMGICLRYSKSREEAIEILNDGFLKVLTRLDKYSEELSFKGWLRRIMINSAIDYYRRNVKHYSQVDISKADLEEISEDALSQLSEKEIILAIQALPPSYRMVFNLFAVEGYKHEEIAEQLNISVGTSKSNLACARVKLRNYFVQQENELKKQYG